MSPAAVPLHVQVLAGPQAGKRLAFDASPVTFGRAADNTLVLDLPTASRRHGEIRFEQGRWVLANLSPNGSRLDGKRVTTKPRPLPPEAEVAIGDQPVFRVWAATETAAVAAGDVPAEAEPPGRALTGRHKVWIGIGVYLVAMLGVFVVLGTLRGGGENGAIATAPELSAEAIRAEVREPLPKEPPDARRVREAIDEARELFALAEVEADALYRAHRAYRRALSYTRGDLFDDPLDQRRSAVIQQRLADEVTARYQRGYNMLRSRQYDAAAREFQALIDFYPDPRSEIFQNAQRQWDAARRAAERRR